MDHVAFDALTRWWHTRLTRRQGGAGLIAAALALAGPHTTRWSLAAAQCLADGARCGGQQHPPCARCCSDTSKKRSGGGRKCVCRRQGAACDANRQCCSRACDATGVCVENCGQSDEYCGGSTEPPCCIGYACDSECKGLLGTACDPVFAPCFDQYVCNAENVCAPFCGNPGVVCLNGAADCCAGLACVNSHCCRPAGAYCDGNVACCPGLACVADVCTA